MKVASLKKPGGLQNIQIETRDDPKPKAGEVLVRVKASSLNYHDFVVAQGGIPAPDGRILMSDGAGEVVEVGEGVSRFKKGDKVLSTFFPGWRDGPPELDKMLAVPGDRIDGFSAELVAASAEGLTRMPEGWSFAEAATLPCAALTAWRGLMVENAIQPGDWVLTQGTGGVSIFALQFAKAAGARVISTSSSDEKLEKLKELGADHVINYKETPEWGAKAKELTGGRGVDEVIEIGGPGTMAQSIAACRIGGHISLIGVLTGISGEVPTAAIEASGIKPVISDHFPLEKLADAFAHQASQKHFGKIVVDI